MKFHIRLSSKFWSSLLPFLCSISAFSAQPDFVIRGACTSDESWSFGDKFHSQVPLSAQEEYLAFLHGKTSPIRSFAEALALRKSSRTPVAKIFAEYWVSRALLEGGFTDIALSGFNAIVASEILSQGWAIQLASIDCVEKLNAKHRVFTFSDDAYNQIPAYFNQKATSLKASSVLKEAVAQTLLRRFEVWDPSPGSLQRFQSLFHLLPEADAYQIYLKGLLQTRLFKTDEAIEEIRKLLSLRALPSSIHHQRNQLHLLLGRLEYEKGNYPAAIEAFKKVDKRSNSLPASLVGLGWSHLLAQSYPEVVGVGIGVQSGWMKRTFVPEALMVTVMALNEICHFPEALRVLGILRREYRASLKWLKQAVDQPDSIKLYPLAISLVKGQELQNPPPPRVSGEWMKSPVFVAYQDGINVLIQQQNAIRKWVDQAEKEQALSVERLLERSKEFRVLYAKAKKKHAVWSPEVVSKMKILKNEVVHYRRFTRAAGIWKAVLTHSLHRVKETQASWIARIEKELRRLNVEMYRNLQGVADNSDLIEVEIFNSAGDDIIERNAQDGRPTEKRKAQGSGRSASEVYQWGAAKVALNGEGEMWEDELDSLKADLSNQCSKYPEVQEKRKPKK